MNEEISREEIAALLARESEEMTREEAIDYNKNLRMYMRLSDKNQPCKFLEENYIALDMAIKALEQEPCEDCISRQGAIDAFSMFAEYESNRTNAEWVDRIRVVLSSLPPVQPIRPSVIENIKAEINQKREENRNGEYDKIFELCLLIIDKHISGKEQA